MRFFKGLISSFLIVVLTTISASAIDTSAKSAVLLNANTFGVIYSQNSDLRLSMASTTKIMTALILVEQNTPERIVTVTNEMVNVEGSSMGLQVGDTVSFADLLYGILLPSGNDAANTAAIAIAGSKEKFAQLMNIKAKELGLHNTNFVTPSGLDAEGHYTTAYDLAILTAYALKNSEFSTAVASTSKTVTVSGDKVVLKNHNKLLKMYDGCIGIKTGYTSKSGRCLVSAAKRGNTTLIAVTLNDRDDWNDHINLLDYGFELTSETVFLPSQTNKIPILASGREFVEIEYEPLIIGVTSNEEISKKLYLPSRLFAPLKTGQVVGYTEYYCNGKLISVSNITVKENCLDSEIKISLWQKFYKMYLLLFRSI